MFRTIGNQTRRKSEEAFNCLYTRDASHLDSLYFVIRKCRKIIFCVTCKTHSCIRKITSNCSNSPRKWSSAEGWLKIPINYLPAGNREGGREIGSVVDEKKFHKNRKYGVKFLKKQQRPQGDSSPRTSNLNQHRSRLAEHLARFFRRVVKPLRGGSPVSWPRPIVWYAAITRE